MEQTFNQGIKDSLLYELAPILAKHFGHMIDSEQAYDMANHIIAQIESDIAKIANSN